MQKRKQFTLGIITLLLLCILAGCQFGNQKKKTEKKVDYYIGVVDNNAPYYYKDADGTEKGLYVTFLDKLSKEQSFTYMFVPMDIYASEQSLSEQSVDGFIGSTVVKTGEKEVLSGSEFYTSDICVLVPKESRLLDMRSLKNKIIAAPAGAGEERFAKYLANKYKGRAITFSHVEEAIGDIEKGYSQALILDKEYYDAHMDASKNWNCLKVSSQFQNNHKFYKVSK